jgi:CMP-N-acetylneuraminic acid synthetase
MPTAVALVPARSGSERVPGKNILPLAGHPLIAYTVSAARASGLFAAVVVSTDSDEIAAVARRYGADVPGLRPAGMATATSPDIEWVLHVMGARDEELFSILRPTSPFRTAETMRRAWRQFSAETAVDSLRAVELCAQHPGKMWVINGNRMRPLLDQPEPRTQPWHSTPYQALPRVYVQNASLEIAWTRVVLENRTIAGDVLMPFVTEGYEGFDINDAHDWMIAERLLAEGAVSLPPVAREPYGAVRA